MDSFFYTPIEIIKMLANGHTLTMNKVFVLLKINNNRI